jgi:transcriptional regulator with XRE-family HTH domain
MAFHVHLGLSMKSLEFSQQVLRRLTDGDRDFLFREWKRPGAASDADQKLKNGEAVSLKSAREALLISKSEVARRLGITSNAYALLEMRSESGQTTIENVQIAAAALGCKLEIVIRPNERQTFAERIWVPLLNEAVQTKWLERMPDRRLCVALPKRIRELLFDPKFRREQKWSRRHHDGRRPPAWYL